jgi:hypothetical protein
VLTWVDDGGADELAGDALAEELADAVDDGGAEVVEVEHVLAHEHHGALEPCMLVQPRQVADDAAQHLRFADALRFLCDFEVVWCGVDDGAGAPWWQGIYSEARRGEAELGRGITGPFDDVCEWSARRLRLRSARSISISSLCPRPRRSSRRDQLLAVPRPRRRRGRLVLIVVYETYGTGRMAASHRGPVAAPSTGDESRCSTWQTKASFNFWSS